MIVSVYIMCICICCIYWPFDILSVKECPEKYLCCFPFTLRYREHDGQLPIHSVQIEYYSCFFAHACMCAPLEWPDPRVRRYRCIGRFGKLQIDACINVTVLNSSRAHSTDSQCSVLTGSCVVWNLMNCKLQCMGCMMTCLLQHGLSNICLVISCNVTPTLPCVLVSIYTDVVSTNLIIIAVQYWQTTYIQMY